MDIQIKKYAQEHFDQIANLCDEFQDYLVAIDPEKRLQRTSEYGVWSIKRKVNKLDSAKAAMYVATDGTRVVGFVFGSVDPAPPDVAAYSAKLAVQGTIEELAVTQEYRGRGIGHMLMEHVEMFLKDQGCEYLGVGVLAFNGEAHSLYEQLGYKDRSVWMSKKISE